ALHVHETDDHYLVSDQVIEEAHPFAFVRREDDVGEIARTDSLACGRKRRFVLPCPRFPHQHQCRHRRTSQSGQHFFSVHGVSPFFLRRKLRSLVVISHRGKLPPQHHRVVFMDHVVAVHRIAPEEVSETEKESYLLAGEQPMHCQDRKSTRLNSSHGSISYAVFCWKKKILISQGFGRAEVGARLSSWSASSAMRSWQRSMHSRQT